MNKLRRWVLLVVLGVVFGSGCTAWQPTTLSPRRVIEEERPDAVRIRQTDGVELKILEPRIDGDSIAEPIDPCRLVGGTYECRANVVALEDVDRLWLADLRGPTAESTWAWMPLLGYAGVGTGLGVLIVEDDPWLYYGVPSPVIWAGFGAGALLGAVVANSASTAAMNGTQPAPGALWGARLGTMLGGATLGAGVASLIIAFSDTWDDERTLATASLIGAGGGVVVEMLIERQLGPRATAPPLLPYVETSMGGRLSFGLSSSRR